MYLLSVATNPYQYESIMLGLLAKKLGYTFKIGGVDWKWEGWRTKMKAYAELTKEIALKEPDAICICSDSYDTLPVREAKDFESEFYSFRKDVVCSAENYCGGNCRPLKYVDVSKAKFKHVNAGLLAGKASALASMWSSFYDQQYTDDQLALSEYVDNSFNNATLDSEARLFFNAGLAFGYEKSHAALSDDMLNGQSVFVIHFSGLNYFSSTALLYKKVLEKLIVKHNLDQVLSMRPVKGNYYYLYAVIMVLLLFCCLLMYYIFKLKFQ